MGVTPGATGILESPFTVDIPTSALMEGLRLILVNEDYELLRISEI